MKKIIILLALSLVIIGWIYKWGDKPPLDDSVGGVTASEVSDSCDNVRHNERDTVGVIEIQWSKVINTPSTYPPSAHNQTWSTISDPPSIPAAYDSSAKSAMAYNAKSSDSLNHKSPTYYPDTVRYKAESTFTANRIVNDSTNAFELKARKGAANGYAGLGAAYVPTAQLGSGSASATTYLRGDQSWATPTMTFNSGHAYFNARSLRDTIQIIGITTSSIFVIQETGSTAWVNRMSDSVKVNTLFVWCSVSDTAKARTKGYDYIQLK